MADSSDVTDSSMDEMPDPKRRRNSVGDGSVDSMKVQDLKDALKARGLDGKGNKAALKERLLQALAEEEEDALASANKDDADDADEGNDTDDAADSVKNDNMTPTNGALSSDEVDSDVPSMPETPGRNLAPLPTNASQQLLSAASRTLEQLNEQSEEDASRSRFGEEGSNDETGVIRAAPLGEDRLVQDDVGRQEEEEEEEKEKEEDDDEEEEREIVAREQEERKREKELEVEREKEEEKIKMHEKRLAEEKERILRDEQDREERRIEKEREERRIEKEEEERRIEKEREERRIEKEREREERRIEKEREERRIEKEREERRIEKEEREERRIEKEMEERRIEKEREKVEMKEREEIERKREEEGEGMEEMKEAGEGGKMETSESNEVENKAQVPKSEDEEEENVETSSEVKENEATEGDEEAADDDEEEDEEENPELQKYWKAVKENPTDFTAWTFLLQFVEQNNKVGPARAAFDAFFKRYPYCYGYWKKFADMERKNDKLKKTEEVFERGVKAIPLSIDLWIHYINFYVDRFGKRPEGSSKIRGLYERAIMSAGLEFRSDKLWDHYISWEASNEEYRHVFALFNKLIAIPTQQYSANFEKFKTLLQSHDPKDLLGMEEYEALAKKINEKKKRKERRKKEEDDEEEEKEEEEDKVDLEIAAEDKHRAQEKLISMKESTFKSTELEVSKRWAFEEGIKRPYFHVKPLEKSQLKNWKDYLDYEIANGAFERVVVLFERCVIACALYEEYWLKYVAYMKKHSVEAARSLFERACTIHLQKKPNIHMEWAAFEEMQDDVEAASNILSNIQSSFPDMLMLSLRLVGLHRRNGDLEKVKELYDKFIAQVSSSSSSKESAAFYAVKYARFLSKTVKSYEKAREVLKEALKKDKENVRLQLQLLEVETTNDVVNETRVLKIFDALIKNEKNDERKYQFSQRRLEFLEEHGTKIETLQQMYDEHQSLGVPSSASNRKRSSDDSDAPEAKKAKSITPTPGGPPPPMAAQPPIGFPPQGAPPHGAMDPAAAAAAAAAWSQQQQQQQQQPPPWAGQGQWSQGQWGQQQGYGYGNYAGYGNYGFPPPQ